MVLFGIIGSGKTFISDIIMETHNEFETINIGDICREIMEHVGISLNYSAVEKRTLGQDIGVHLRKINVNLLNDYVNGKIVIHNEKENSLKKLWIITGGRTKDDLMYWRKKKYLTIGVTSTQSLDRTMHRDGSDQAEARNHITETEVDELIQKRAFDEIIVNGKDLNLLMVDIVLNVKL